MFWYLTEFRVFFVEFLPLPILQLPLVLIIFLKSSH